LACSGSALGLDAIPDLFIYDVVENWRAFIGLPAVLAVWAAHKDVITPQIARDFEDSLAFGKRHLDEICAGASRDLHLPAAKLRRYLTENIDFSLDDENLAGLGAYFGFAAEIGRIEKTRPIEFTHAIANTSLASSNELEPTRRV
jgi:chorismate dehydratase